ncbi:hypothetical protein LTR96_003043 [Exophiala xenobiotica]|nr:hypothetical protein LTR96_003043 [Exophiala xenobiotica]KAK5279182.1 hypothetical protein LTR40_008162 [Exophiala xenobiotica]KAK5342454.1 hypothetical protein LTR98_000079 [Exophiala xenobiotica]KAK5374665.1 hypothetical protein LTS13_005233 [Exophiala xenobiotica]KAK5396816.1 hypothetical protein LTR79_005452 [Exophiala xenobiotica]
MPSKDFIDVRVLVDGQPLVEYHNPDGEVEHDQKLTRYVEVKGGQKFSVRMALMPGFEFRHAPLVHSRFRVDVNGCYTLMNVEYSECDTYKGTLGKALERKFVCTPWKDESPGTWHNYEFEFGALGVGEESPLPADLSPSEIDLLGSLLLTVYRGKPQKLDKPYVFDEEMPKIVTELPERLLKGKEIKNNMQFSSRTPASSPSVRYHDYIPIKGNNGRPYEFVFLYRSRRILQNLGCIPRSPSPPADPALMLQRTEDMLRIIKQRERELNLRNMALEDTTLVPTRAGGIKTELNSNWPPLDQLGRYEVLPRIKAEPRDRIPPPPLFDDNNKRKREGSTEEDGNEGLTKRARLQLDENVVGTSATGHSLKRKRQADDEQELQEIAPPAQRSRVVIDLTDD